MVTGLKIGVEIKDNNGAGNVYKIIQKLGAGGNGVAYLVHCTNGSLAGNFFTLKFLNTNDKVRAERFLKEVTFIKTHKHPSILNHYDEGDYNGYPYVVTEYLRHNLDDVIKYIELKDALIYSVQLLSAVNFLQKNNYVHRDIKPKNIFIDNSYVVLGDFGLIKNLNELDISNDDMDYVRDAMPKQYRTPQLVEYMSSGVMSPKTDIFQLGLVIYEIFHKNTALLDSPKKSSPITEESFRDKNARIKSLRYRDRIEPIIWNMLSLDESKIRTSDQLLDEFQNILLDYFKEIRDIEFKIVL